MARGTSEGGNLALLDRDRYRLPVSFLSTGAHVRRHAVRRVSRHIGIRFSVVAQSASRTGPCHVSRRQSVRLQMAPQCFDQTTYMLTRMVCKDAAANEPLRPGANVMRVIDKDPFGSQLVLQGPHRLL